MLFQIGMAPSTAAEDPIASLSHCACGLPLWSSANLSAPGGWSASTESIPLTNTLFRIVAGTRIPSSKSWNPLSCAAADLAMAEQSSTRMTGAPSHLAISAVLPASVQPSFPSYRPMQPSTRATMGSSPVSPSYLARAAHWKASTHWSRPPRSHPSRLTQGLRVAPPPLENFSRCLPSKKSGPTLKGCTTTPALCRASDTQEATRVLPTPLLAPETTRHPTSLDVPSLLLLATLADPSPGPSSPVTMVRILGIDSCSRIFSLSGDDLSCAISNFASASSDAR
mmetsp:Transcript_10597/g.37608  ORF Transcript_10597/g.37608 Transcript_10597/m.37608 type:complete len:282 (-) Transcript_10597:247-1092(-)